MGCIEACLSRLWGNWDLGCAARAAHLTSPRCPAPTACCFCCPLLPLCADAGGLVETANERARLALWFGLQVRARGQLAASSACGCCKIDAEWVLHV